MRPRPADLVNRAVGVEHLELMRQVLAIPERRRRSFTVTTLELTPGHWQATATSYRGTLTSSGDTEAAALDDLQTQIRRAVE